MKKNAVEMVLKQKVSAADAYITDIEKVYDHFSKWGSVAMMRSLFLLGYVYGKRSERENRKREK